jgi:hypothetical protein
MDLEVYSVKDIPVVAHSTDDANFNFDVENSIPLSDVLKRIASDGFSGTSPNPNDPIFIQLRIKNTKASKIESIISDKLGPRLYNSRLIYDELSNSKMMKTPMSELMGKIIIIVEKDIISNDKSLKNADMESGRIDFRKYTNSRLNAELFTPPNIQNDNIRTDVKIMKIVVPDTDTNLDAIKLVTDYGTQIVANRFYAPDYALTEYEKVFNDIGTAFVPIHKILKYKALNAGT